MLLLEPHHDGISSAGHTVCMCLCYVTLWSLDIFYLYRYHCGDGDDDDPTIYNILNNLFDVQYLNMVFYKLMPFLMAQYWTINECTLCQSLKSNQKSNWDT